MRPGIVTSFWQRIWSGLNVFFPLAIFWGLFATLVYTCGDDPHPERHASLPSLLALYFGGAILCGAAYGLLKDWARTDLRYGIMCSGIGFSFSVVLMLMVSDWQITKVDRFAFFTLGFFGVAFGPPFGFYFRSRYGSEQSMPNGEL